MPAKSSASDNSRHSSSWPKLNARRYNAYAPGGTITTHSGWSCTARAPVGKNKLCTSIRSQSDVGGRRDETKMSRRCVQNRPQVKYQTELVFRVQPRPDSRSVMVGNGMNGLMLRS